MKLNKDKTQQLIINNQKIKQKQIKTTNVNKNNKIICTKCQKSFLCSGVHIHNARAHPEFIQIKSATIDQKEIINTENYKYLGKILSNELNPDEQWTLLSKKINSNIFLIKTMKNLGFKTKI